MENIDTAHLVYLVVLLIAIGGWFLASGRLLKSLQQASAWVLIFLVTIAGVGIWQDIQGERPFQTRIEDSGRIIAERGRGGHYHLTLDINGVPTHFLVDTGATDIVLTLEDAEAAGIGFDQLKFMGRANTANGEVSTAPVRLESVQIGPVTDRDVYAVVNGGEMDQSLLGMEYLQRWGTIEITGGELILTR
ncbi:MAG: TIGR02281 family clan AA aspartic protease [Paracoccaceae bacterium]